MKNYDRKQLTFSPLRAIRNQCLWCSANQVKEILECTSQHCPFYELRSGKAQGNERDHLHLIKRKCLDCMTGSRAEVEKCNSVDCALWIFRFGKYP